VCLALYIGADHPLPLVPWREDHRGFNVVTLADHERVVVDKFSKSHLAYAGAHTGCSCGFRYGEDPPSDAKDEEEERPGRASVESLRQYLEALLRHSPAVELYACWEGDWAEPSAGSREVALTYFGGERFALEERWFLTVLA
jgi:hypothetical protein